VETNQAASEERVQLSEALVRCHVIGMERVGDVHRRRRMSGGPPTVLLSHFAKCA